MDHDFYTDDFEELLKQKADQYKIYPSDKVWKNINQSIHPRRRGFTIGGLLLLLIGGFLITEESMITDTNSKHIADHSIIDASRPSASSDGFREGQIEAQHQSVPAISTPAKLISIAARRNSAGDPAFGTATINATPEATEQSFTPSTIDAPLTQHQQSIEIKTGANKLMQVKSLTNLLLAPPSSAGNIAALSLPSVKKKRVGLEVYLSPTVSYRRLAEDKSFNKEFINTPVAFEHQDVNRFVDHKPALGIELGASGLFYATPSFILKAGLQFNYMRYSIRAYSSNPERTTIALSTGRNTADTLASYSSYRNVGGKTVEDLQNQYFQVSAPIGLELKVLGNRKLQFNIAGSIQPTYLISQDSYMLSSDLANYTKEPSLARRWNVYSSVETFISYTKAGIQWKIGPEFRYQLLSSYNNRYPIHEYLMEYGFKIGVSKTLR